jgi:hypothetical protein
MDGRNEPAANVPDVGREDQRKGLLIKSVCPSTAGRRGGCLRVLAATRINSKEPNPVVGDQATAGLSVYSHP